MTVFAFSPSGFEGELVRVEVDIRRGIPAFDLTGLPDDAIKESRERVRAAVRNSGFQFPVDRVLVNLAPAGVRKTGSSFDLPIALAILGASGQLPDPGKPFLAVGELLLSGDAMPALGVLSAVAAALSAGIDEIIVPPSNMREAQALEDGHIRPLAHLSDATQILARLCAGTCSFEPFPDGPTVSNDGSPLPGDGRTRFPDMADIRGQSFLRRALEVAAAGSHHVMLFGPPGSGKTLGATRMPSILPELDRLTSIETTKLHSLAGVLPATAGLIHNAPFRAPHHGASAEGIVGGGKRVRPGEISLANGGILFLDEAPEFRVDILQALREPLEQGRIAIARAGSTVWFPANFQLVLASNPCPCGNLGRKNGICLCSIEDIKRYWKRLGGPLLDRIDIRVPVNPPGARALCGPPGETSAAIQARVVAARKRQAHRFRGRYPALNAHIPAGEILSLCNILASALERFSDRAETMGLTGRASHSVLKVARTIADLSESEQVDTIHLDEALQLRRYGEDDVFWRVP